MRSLALERQSGLPPSARPKGKPMSETAAATSFLSDSFPILVEGMDFPTYLGDPAPLPSITSSLVRDLLRTAPRKVWQNCARLNPDYEPERKGSSTSAVRPMSCYVGQGAGIVVVRRERLAEKDRPGSKSRCLCRWQDSDQEKRHAARRGHGGSRETTIRATWGASSLSSRGVAPRGFYILARRPV